VHERDFIGEATMNGFGVKLSWCPWKNV